MTTISNDSASPPARQRGALFFLKWLALLSVMTVLWWSLIFVLRPAQAGAEWHLGRALLNFAPPVLATLLCWVVVRSAALPVALAPAAAGEAVAPAAPRPLLALRVGAWAAATPFGSTAATLAGLLDQKAAFALDRAIRHPNGSPAHAGVIQKLNLERFGVRADTRDSAMRIGAMLLQILDDLHQQQLSLLRTVEGAPLVFCVASPALLSHDPELSIVRNAWGRSAWAERDCDLRPLVDEPLAVAKLIGALQRGDLRGPGGYVLILAADSLIDPVQLAPALAAGKIFSGSTPQGWIPSEGAAGLVLIDPALSPESQWLTTPLLGPAVASDSDPATDQTLSHAASRALANALALAKRKAADIGMLFNDADHRGNTSADVLKAMHSVLPHLDPVKHRVTPMEFAGNLGAAGEAINLVLAAELCNEIGQVTGVLSRDGQQAVSILTMPAP